MTDAGVVKSLTEGASDSKRRLSGWTLFAALVALVAFGVFVFYMVTQVESNEVQWTRLAWVFASVEAIAFGAAGALFGSSIQRERAESAENRANVTAEKSKVNAEQAATGRALAATLVADETELLRTSTGVHEAEGAKIDGDAKALAKKHAALARALFP